jgi:hypothetical protein
VGCGTENCLGMDSHHPCIGIGFRSGVLDRAVDLSRRVMAAPYPLSLPHSKTLL